MSDDEETPATAVVEEPSDTGAVSVKVASKEKVEAKRVSVSGEEEVVKKRCIRDFWVCYGLLFIFALLCGIGFAVLHVTQFQEGKPKGLLMQKNRITEYYGVVRGNKNVGTENSTK